jgi:hypothetical protein
MPDSVFSIVLPKGGGIVCREGLSLVLKSVLLIISPSGNGLVCREVLSCMHEASCGRMQTIRFNYTSVQALCAHLRIQKQVHNDCV